MDEGSEDVKVGSSVAFELGLCEGGEDGSGDGCADGA